LLANADRTRRAQSFVRLRRVVIVSAAGLSATRKANSGVTFMYRLQRRGL
jgi:hypothetical protein